MVSPLLSFHDLEFVLAVVPTARPFRCPLSVSRLLARENDFCLLAGKCFPDNLSLTPYREDGYKLELHCNRIKRAAITINLAVGLEDDCQAILYRRAAELMITVAFSIRIFCLE